MSRIALLFDLDGTLVDTDALHVAAFSAVLREASGRELGEEEYTQHIMGAPNHAILSYLFPGDEARHADLIERKEAMFRDSLSGALEPVAGVHEILDWADAHGAGVAVVTNAPRPNAEAMLAGAGLAARFETVVIGEELERAKPDPMAYRTAMERLGATPSRSVAFEDSGSGLRAARGSGAHVFGRLGGLDRDALLQAGAHQVIADFTDRALRAHLDTMKARVA